MYKIHKNFKAIFLSIISLLFYNTILAQLNLSDSVFFAQIFDQQKYANDTNYPGNWYINENIDSSAQLISSIDSMFKYSLQDFKHIDSIQVSDTLVYDSIRNDTYNNYFFAYQQTDPLIHIDYSLNGKQSAAYSFYFPYDTANQSKFAFLLVPGNGSNETTNLLQGLGYHNILCYVSNYLKSLGDLYAFVKPNEEPRAIYNNYKKLNHSYLVSYTDTSLHHPYGLNYLTELIATIKYLQKKYCKVFVLGLSEGGYASLLASLYTHPDGAVIGSGYSVGFDTSWNSYSLLQPKFDSLVFLKNKDTIKNNILNNHTQYFFSYGDSDYVNMIQSEHDSNYTEKSLADTVHCKFFYDFNLHTFPYCNIIDNFIFKILRTPVVSFTVFDSTNIDTMYVQVSNCSNAQYNFDLFRNDTLLISFNGNLKDTIFALVDSGKYYLKNIFTIFGDSTLCTDTLIFQKIIIPNSLSNSTVENIHIRYNNPVFETLTLNVEKENSTYMSYTIYDIFGVEKIKRISKESEIRLHMKQLPSGYYLLMMSDGYIHQTEKIIKL